MAEFLQSWIAGLVGHPVPPINSLTFWGDYAKAISESPYVRFSVRSTSRQRLSQFDRAGSVLSGRLYWPLAGDLLRLSIIRLQGA